MAIDQIMTREEILILNQIHVMTQHLDQGAIPWVIEVSEAKKQLQQGTVLFPSSFILTFLTSINLAILEMHSKYISARQITLGNHSSQHRNRSFWMIWILSNLTVSTISILGVKIRKSRDEVDQNQ